MLLGATALAGALSMVTAGQALAQSSEIKFDQPAQPLAQALRSYSAVADREIIFADALVAGRTAPPLKGQYTAEGALVALLDGTGLKADRTASGVLLIQRADNPQSGSAAGDGADSGTVQALVVTAQKREENIQDVPIAISAFTEKTLQEQKIEGGFDLLKAIPNVTFSKNNFTSYNFSIRGIGTKAVSATTDPGVAVSFNNIALLQNRLFEQEYFDI
ncbi:MAG: secretin and TonB N-terminal domain-containing protein, partial [Ignavibacteriales bacterium]